MRRTNYVEGVLRKVDEIIDITPKFSKRDIFVEVPVGQFTTLARFQLCNMDVHQSSPAHVGKKVRVHFDIWGKDKGNYHVQNLNAFLIEFIENG